MFFTIRPSDLLLIGQSLHSIHLCKLVIFVYPSQDTLVDKTLLGLTPPYLRYLLQPSSSTFNTCSASHILLKGPQSTHIPSRSSFQFAAASNWNKVQTNTQTGQFYLTVVAALRDVLLSLLSCTLCCCHVVVMLCCCHAMFLS